MPVTDPHVIDLQQIVPQVFAYNAYALASFVVLYYEYLLTLPDEVLYFWQKRRTPVTVLFFLNRYVNLLGNIPLFLQAFVSWSDEVCANFQIYNQSLLVVSQIIVGAILCIRTYALYERRRSILWALNSVVLIALSIAIWSFIGQNSNTQFTLSCQPLSSKQDGISMAISWSTVLFFDSFIFTMTIYKALCIWKMGSGKLSVILLRDGSVYYLIMALANLSNILTSILAPFVLKAISITFANIIAVVMINRLMINLQDPKLFVSTSEGNITLSRTRQPTLGPFVTTVVDRGTINDTVQGTDTDTSVSFTDIPRTRIPAARSGTPWFSDSEAGLSPISSSNQTTSGSTVVELQEMRRVADIDHRVALNA